MTAAEPEQAKHLCWWERGVDKVWRCKQAGCDERRDKNGKPIVPNGPPIRGHLKLVV